MKTTRKNNRGSAFITTMWVLIAVSGVVLVLSRSMRVEAIASANRLSQAQAEAAERGAEQFLCSVLDQEIATPGSTASVSMEARQIGNGYFWVMKPDPDNEQNHAYGMTDEGAKLDINTASETMLSILPNMSPDLGASIVNWRRRNPTSDGLGATDTDYESIKPESYDEKHAFYESTEEVMLVKGITTDILYGHDKNRNGTVDANELQAAGSTASIAMGSNTSNRGIFPYITAYGLKATTSPTTSSTGQKVVDVNTSSANSLTKALQSALGGRTKEIVQKTLNLRPQGVNGPAGPGDFFNVFDWAVQMGMSSSDLSKVFFLVTATGTAGNTAKINVNTAPLQVLMCIPGLEQSDAQAIVSYRQSKTPANPADVSWLIDAIPSTKLRFPETAGNFLTGTSCIYSGDIVGVSGDGRAFRRYRVVVDGSKTPAYVVYRRDLTALGWPLPGEIRASMRAGRGPSDAGAKASASTSLLGKGL